MRTSPSIVLCIDDIFCLSDGSFFLKIELRAPSDARRADNQQVREERVMRVYAADNKGRIPETAWRIPPGQGPARRATLRLAHDHPQGSDLLQRGRGGYSAPDRW